MDRFDHHPSIDQDQDGGSQRARVRDSLFLMGSLTLPDDGKTRDVRIRNLSEGGLMIEIERPIAVGTAVALVLRGIGDITGTVAWCTQGRIGVALDHPIDPRRARKQIGGGARTPFYAKPLISR